MLDAERLLKAGYLALCHGDTKTLLTEKGSRPRRKRLVVYTSDQSKVAIFDQSELAIFDLRSDQ